MNRGACAILSFGLAALTATPVCAKTQKSQPGSVMVRTAQPGIDVFVVDGTGAVIQRADVSVRNSAGSTAGGSTDDSGRFSLPDVVPGDYTVLVQARGFKNYLRSVVVVPNEVISVSATLEAAGTDDPIGSYTVAAVPTQTSSLDEQSIRERSGDISRPSQVSTQTTPRGRLRRFFSVMGRRLGI